MGGLIPLGDASRRPRGFAGITLLIILANAYVFLRELSGGNGLVLAWSVIPDHITHGRHLVTILTSMFMHASWMHIVGNMVFLWAFGPAIEDAMGHIGFIVFYLAGGVIATMAQILGDPHSLIPC
ncbi:MAG: rhomboid family intramembrane serine protease, partial [Terracidiphilus sp.]